MTLCLTVTYRQCRECLPSTVDRATKQLAASCAVLEDLGSQWWTAEAMAKLGRQAIGKIRKTEKHAGGRQQARHHPTATSEPEPKGASNCVPEVTMVGNLGSSGDGGSSSLQHVQESDFLRGGPSAPTLAPEGWDHQYTTPGSGGDGQGSSVYDMFLLDSIPNLVYPEAGMGDGLFDGVRLFDGFGMVMQNNSST